MGLAARCVIYICVGVGTLVGLTDGSTLNRRVSMKKGPRGDGFGVAYAGTVTVV